MKTYLSLREYAKLLSISHSTVQLAIREGRLYRFAKGIDPNHPTNLYFAKRTRERIAKKKKKERAAKKKVTKKTEVKNKSTPSLDDMLGTDPESSSKGKNKKLKSESEKPIEDYLEDNKTTYTKYDADVEKVKMQTAHLQLKLAEQVKLFIRKNLVDKAFGQLHSVATNHFLNLGDRLAPILAGYCGNSDPEVIKQIKEKIDFESTRGLDEIKRITKEFI